jgi:hypothetical protein
MVGSIIQHDQRGLVQVCNELVSEPSNGIVAVENFVVVSKMISLLLGAEGPDGARNQSSLVLSLLMRFHHDTRVWPLDGCTEAISSPLVFLFLVDHIFVVAWIKEEAVLIAMADSGVQHGCNSHLCTPL